MTTIRVPDPLPPAITRPRQHVEAVLAQSLLETGGQGRAALAWTWALTGTRPSPVTLSVAKGSPPSRDEITAEASAPPEGSTAPPGVPTDFCDQLREARHILRWLIGDTDEIPVDDDNRGRFIGARDDYASSGTRPSPVTLSLAKGNPPVRDEITAEASAPPQGSTAPPGVPPTSATSSAKPATSSDGSPVTPTRSP